MNCRYYLLIKEKLSHNKVICYHFLWANWLYLVVLRGNAWHGVCCRQTSH